MKRWFNPNKFRVIFLVPIAMYATQNGGCASTPEAGPLTSDQIVKTVSGNTAAALDGDIYALISANGTLTGLNLPNGARTGAWRVTSNSLLCASWRTDTGDVENCAQLSYVGDDTFQWGDKLIKIFEGNPKNL